MKKIVIITALSFGLFILNANAQGTLSTGSTQLNAGVGLSSWGIPVYVGLDYGLNQDFTLGGEASFRGYKEKWSGKNYNHSIIGLSGNLNYHFNRILSIPSKFDFYGGANVGFFVWTSPDDYGGSRSSGLGLGGQIGGRYYLNNKVGLNLELGGGNAFSGGKFGLTI